MPATTPTETTTTERTTTMQAVVQHRYGSADTLELATIARPTPTAGQVLVEVDAAGVDRGTAHLMTGQPYLVRLAGFGVTRPKQPVPGFDLAGRVAAVGEAVTRFAVGDTVFGIGSGAFAEYAVAEEDKLVHLPDGVEVEAAGVAAISGITALQALTDVGGLEPGQRVLVIGASGGVGTYATQLAVALGARVTGVAGTANLELVRSLGADAVIDHRREQLDAAGVDYDLVLDIGGRTPVRRLRRLLAERGTLVIVGGEGGNRLTGGVGRQLRALALSPFVRQRLTTFISKEEGESIERLAAFLASGAVAPVISQRFDLAGVPDALRRLESGVSGGKAVIVVR